MTITVGAYDDADFAGVDTLWQKSFPDDPPWNRAAAAIPRKLKQQPELFLVARDGDTVIGTVMAGYDGHRGWIYALAVDPRYRGRGVGADLLREAEARLTALGCMKVNLQVRGDNQGVIGFYQRNGFSVEPRVSLGKRLR